MLHFRLWSIKPPLQILLNSPSARVLVHIQNKQTVILNGETTKRGPQVRGLPSWTWSVDYTRGPLAKFCRPDNGPSSINPSLGSRDLREPQSFEVQHNFIIHFRYLFHNQCSFR